MAVPTPSIEELQSQISSLTARLAEKEEELKEKDTEILSLHAQVKLLNTRLKSGSEKETPADLETQLAKYAYDEKNALLRSWLESGVVLEKILARLHDEQAGV